MNALLLAVVMLSQAPATQGAATPAALRLVVGVGQPMRLDFTGEVRSAAYLPQEHETRLVQERDQSLRSSVFLAPMPAAVEGARFRVLICSVTTVVREISFGRDVTAAARQRPSRGRDIALDEYVIDAAGCVVEGEAPASRPVPSIFTTLTGRHMEVPHLPFDPVTPGAVFEEALTAREGAFTALREVGLPTERAGRPVVPLRFQLRQTPGAGDLRVASWTAEQVIDRETGTLAAYRSRLRFILGTSQRDVSTSIEGGARETITAEAFEAARQELAALRALSDDLRADRLAGIDERLADLAARFPQPAFPDKQAQLRDWRRQLTDLDDPRVGERRLLLPNHETSCLLWVPEDYDPKVAHKLLVILHGAGGQPDGYFRSFLKPLEGKRVILAALKSRGTTWTMNVDQAALRHVAAVVSRTYTIDRGQVFLLGHSAGAVMALVEALTAQEARYRGVVVAAGTLPPQLRGLIRRQADPALLERIKGLTFYFVVGADDRNFPPASVRGDADLLKGAGAAVVYRELPGWGHAYPAAENAAIADWLSRQ